MIAWLLFDGWHGLPGGVGENLCSIFPSAAQRGYTGLERLVYNGKANELLAEGGDIAQAEEQRIVIAVELEIASEIGAVAHDVVAVGIAGGVELTLSGDVPVRDHAGALQDEVGYHGGGEVLAGEIAIAGVVSIDEETRVGVADLLHYATAKEATFKAELIHGLASGLSQVGGGYRVGDAQGHNELILPKEGAAIEIKARSLDCVVAVGPLGQARDCLGDNEHIVVHDPKPPSS